MLHVGDRFLDSFLAGQIARPFHVNAADHLARIVTVRTPGIVVTGLFEVTDGLFTIALEQIQPAQAEISAGIFRINGEYFPVLRF